MQIEWNERIERKSNVIVEKKQGVEVFCNIFVENAQFRYLFRILSRIW